MYLYQTTLELQKIKYLDKYYQHLNPFSDRLFG